MEKFIVKVQLPLASSEEDPPALVYNEDRSIYGHIAVTEELVEALDGSPKKYFWAHIENKELNIDLRNDVTEATF